MPDGRLSQGEVIEPELQEVVTSGARERPTPQDVIRAFMMILGRPPESQAAIEHHCRLDNLATLGETLIRSAEFRTRYLHQLLPQPSLLAPVERGAASRGLVGLAQLDFGAAGDGAPWLLGEWAIGEDDGRWTLGRRSMLRLAVPPGYEEFLLRLAVRPFHAPKTLAIECGGIVVLRERVSRSAVLTVRIAGEMVQAGSLTLTLLHDDAERPCDVSASGDSRLLALKLRRAWLEAAEPEGPPLAASAVATRFESLGEECDFGLFQSGLQHEPLSLLRYSTVRLPELITAIDTRFDGFAEAGTTTIRASGNGEYLIEEASTRLVGHTGRRLNGSMPVDEASLLRTQTARLGLLKRLLNQRLDGGDTIFVLRQAASEPLSAVLPLWQALRRRGDNTLLWVTDAEPGRPCGTVTMIDDGLMQGYIDPWQEREVRSATRMLAWQVVCRRAFRLWSRTARPG